ncbi:MAG: GH3 auxin-responsive promoter family protein [Chitinophagales bacterium]|nr:GH3 auxin-responsive promoter family protein [Chitinophagales bacterium]MCO5281327.1 GH3 auxin-responsive promoter family protein [Chitinophagales bacterium]HRP39071.1 GH3 auxin-responsive promoter family protein [Chitinophagales bacterium]
MFGFVGNIYVQAKIQSLNKIRESAVELQELELDKIIYHNRKVSYLKQFAAISTNYASFVSHIPVVTYEDLKPYIEKMMRGEENILCADSITNFAKSSGTTDVSKYIPVSKSSMFKGHFQGSRHLLASYFERFPNNKIFKGKNLVVSGSLQTVPNNPSAFVGDVSAILTNQIPQWIQRLRTPDLATALLSNWDEKLNAIARQTAFENVTGLSGVPSWSLELLKAVLQISGKKNIEQVWHNFELYIHGGVNFSPYQTQFENIVGKRVNYINAYNASEGFFAFSDTENTDELLLLPQHDIFYEFRELEHPQQIVPLEGVIKNVLYEIILTTNSGLWRYALGDTVEFTSINPYRFKIVGRTKQYINIAGEELMVHNAEEAIAAASKTTGMHVQEFSAAPLFLEDGKICHQWFIEFENTPKSTVQFQHILDEKLQQLNSDYKAKRSGNYILQPLQIVAVPQNLFRNWLGAKEKLGGQHKVPRLSNNRIFAEEFLALITT